MLLISVIILLGLFILNLLFGIKYGFGLRHYWFFETLHFLGGFFLAMFLANFTPTLINECGGCTSSKILIFIGIAIVSFFWETAEYLLWKITKLSAGFKRTFDLKKNMNLKPKWQDTILDVILNFAGAAIFIYLI